MKIPINLASQPFRRDRPVFIASALVGLLLIGLLGALISLAMMDRTQFADTRTNIDQLEKQMRKLSAEQAGLERVLHKPENAEVLERSVFLNTLIFQKGISWTKIFADLESTLPHNVRVMQIRPFVSGQHQVTLEMTVGTESPEPFIELLKKMETSPLFRSPYMHGSLPPSQTEPLYRYRVSVNYAQKL